MSRGIGRTQREAMLCLRRDTEGDYFDGMPLGVLKRAISTDRSNARRAIRGLMERGLVEEVRDDEGERRVRLTGGAHLALFLAGYPEEALTLRDVPSRPLDLDLPYDEDPLGSAEPSWITAAVSESALTDNARRSPRRRPHANPETPCGRRGELHPPVRDNGPHTPSIALEIVQKMARRVLARLNDEGAGEEGA